MMLVGRDEDDGGGWLGRLVRGEAFVGMRERRLSTDLPILKIWRLMGEYGTGMVWI